MPRLDPLETYIRALEAVLARHFTPGGIYHGREGALRLAREVGCGLADSPLSDVERIISSLYSRLLVRFTFGRAGGVPLDNAEFVGALRAARRDEVTARAQRQLLYRRWWPELASG